MLNGSVVTKMSKKHGLYGHRVLHGASKSIDYKYCIVKGPLTRHCYQILGMYMKFYSLKWPFSLFIKMILPYLDGV